MTPIPVPLAMDEFTHDGQEFIRLLNEREMTRMLEHHQPRPGDRSGSLWAMAMVGMSLAPTITRVGTRIRADGYSVELRQRPG